MHKLFKLHAPYTPTGDQPGAIGRLVESIQNNNRYQMLLGVTGSGKTFSMANIIERVQRPVLIMSHNKTLAAQLYSEFKSFFPENAVEYFVSYYDYYRPEAYIPQTDTYIEKDSAINDDIERLRIAASSALVSRRDVIVVASVSCIYGLGTPESFVEMMIRLEVGKPVKRQFFLERLVENLYERNDIHFVRGKFRVRGDTVDVFPAYMESAIRIEWFGDEIDGIYALNPITGNITERLTSFDLYPANQYVTTRTKLERALVEIRKEMEQRIDYFEKNNQLIEAQRIKMRTEYDLEMLQEMGFCSGIENYSRIMSEREPGGRPSCLIDFFPKDFLVFIDESHVTVPQIGGMYAGDYSRKKRLVDFGFRLPSALDNRPLKADEFWEVTNQILFVSATPGPYEYQNSKTIAEQLIRPTGLLDPVMEVRPIKGQVEDIIGEIKVAVANKERVLVTALTKRMSEDLASFLEKESIKVTYLHSDIDAVERVEILKKLRSGEVDVLVGVNLLREGLDLPEVALVGILDADKEGFLRSETSIIQTAGRAARHVNGRVILYADIITGSISRSLAITQYRRDKQIAYNKEHNIVPHSVQRGLQSSLFDKEKEQKNIDPISLKGAKGDRAVAEVLADLEEAMLEAAEKLQFEKAAMIRDEIEALRGSSKNVAPSDTFKKAKSKKSDLSKKRKK